METNFFFALPVCAYFWNVSGDAFKEIVESEPRPEPS